MHTNLLMMIWNELDADLEPDILNVLVRVEPEPEVPPTGLDVARRNAPAQLVNQARVPKLTVTDLKVVVPTAILKLQHKVVQKVKADHVVRGGCHQQQITSSSEQLATNYQ
jgi:hypothetical protein